MKCLLTIICFILLGAAAPAAKPSFSCNKRLTKSEQAICADPELAAWDRAVSKVYGLIDKPAELAISEQKDWLAQRDACGSNRDCLLGAFRKWPGFEVPVTGFGMELHRQGTDPIEPADLEVMPIYGTWYYFSVNAQHIRGENVHTGSFAGAIDLHNGEAKFDEMPGEQYACRFRIARISSSHWTIDQFDSDAMCGGLNVYMAGDYRIAGRKRQ